MLQNLKHAAVMLLSVIMLTAATSAQDYGFSIPTGTPENPLLDVKYKFDTEPEIFDDRNIRMRTYIRCTATYADGSVVEQIERTGNYIGWMSVYGMQSYLGKKECIAEGDWAELVYYEDKKLWVFGVSATEWLYDFSEITDKDVFAAFYNLKSEKVILPTSFRGAYGHDDITFIEYEDTTLDDPENPDYDLYGSYDGIRIYVYLTEDWAMGSCPFLAEAQHALFNLTATINDGNHTVAFSGPIEFKDCDITLTSLGNQYGYMDTIKSEMTIELEYDGISYRFEGDSFFHIAYPTNEKSKAAAREAGYNVP